MKAHCELKLIGSPIEQEKLIQGIEKRLNNGWTRCKEMEAEARSSQKMEFKIFVCSQTDSRPAAALHFALDNNNDLWVCNIMSTKQERLSMDNCNSILEEFQTSFVEPAAKGLDIKVITTPAERNIDNLMSAEMAQRLRQFSATANKSTGGNHPLDEAIFFNFIIQAHQENAMLNESDLNGLLIEDGWSRNHADNLSRKYRFGRELLKQYDKF